MLENDRRKARERRTKQMDDERVLAECRQQLEADKEIQVRMRGRSCRVWSALGEPLSSLANSVIDFSRCDNWVKAKGAGEERKKNRESTTRVEIS